VAPTGTLPVPFGLKPAIDLQRTARPRLCSQAAAGVCFLPYPFGKCSCITSARLRSRMRHFGYCSIDRSPAMSGFGLIPAFRLPSGKVA
jgi:hypothetical protein